MIVVTGGRGFIGASLVKYLSREDEVVSVSTGNHQTRSGRVMEIGCEHAGLPDVLQKASLFIHAAGKVRGKPEELELANVEAVRRYIGWLPSSVSHVICLSTTNVNFRDWEAYGHSKWLGEQLWVSAPCTERVTTLRLSLVYGPGDKKNLYRLIRLVQKWPVLPVPAAGRFRPVFLQDAVELVGEIARKGLGKAETWIITGKEEITYPGLAALISRVLRERRLILPLPAVLTGFAGKLSKRLRGLQEAKTWHDARVWNHLPRAVTPLDEGVRLTVERYLKELDPKGLGDL